MVEIVHPDSNAFLKKLMFQGKFAPCLDDLFRHHPESYRHSARVAQLVHILGHLNKISDSDLAFLVKVGLLHDIGKTYIPIEILDSTTPLQEPARETLRTHTRHGSLLLKRLREERISQAVAACHEFQPNGYPRNHPDRREVTRSPVDRRVYNPKVSAAAEITAAVDMCDALTSNRPYINNLSPEEIRNILRAQFLGKPCYIDQILNLRYKNLPSAESCV